MAGEFTKSTSMVPAVVGAIADADAYNKNIANQSKDSVLFIDEDGVFADGDIGDETKGSVGSLVTDIKMREGGLIKFYNASGVFQSSAFLGQATESQIGQAEIATQAETDAGTNDISIVTPLKLQTSPIAGYQFISSTVISNDSVIDFTDLDAFTSYKFIFENIVPVTNSVYFFFRTSPDNGSSYRTGGTDYRYAINSITGVGENNAQGSEGTNTIPLSSVSGGFQMSNDSDTGFTGELNLYNLTSTTEEFLSVVLGCYQNSGASKLNKVSGGGNRANVEVVNAVRFAFSSGNLSSGTIKLYGIK